MATESSSSRLDQAAGPILVPLDGSSIAEQALPVAATIAHRSGRKVHLAAVVQPVLPVLGTEEELAAEPGLEAELRQQTGEYLEATLQALQTTHGVQVSHAVLDGDPAQTLADHARARHVSHIVMTSHGHTRMNRLWLGSVADRLLRRVKMPVLLLRPDAALQTEFRCIVIALDGLSEGEAVLEPAIELGSLFPEAQFTLAMVVEPPVSLITRMAMQPARMRPHWRELQENSARSYLERIATSLRTRGLRVATRMIGARGIAEQLLNLAGSMHADLLVVGTHGARGVERMLLGSVADKVVRGASQSVLVIPTRKNPE